MKKIYDQHTCPFSCGIKVPHQLREQNSKAECKAKVDCITDSRWNTHDPWPRAVLEPFTTKDTLQLFKSVFFTHLNRIFLRFPYLRELSKITKLSRAKKMEWIATMRLRMQIKPSHVLQNNITPRATFDWRIKSFPGLGTSFGDINQTELCMILCLFQLVRTFLSH